MVGSALGQVQLARRDRRFDDYEGQIAIQVVVFFVDQDLCLIFLTVRMHLCLCLKGCLCVHVFAYLFVDVFVCVCV